MIHFWCRPEVMSLRAGVGAILWMAGPCPPSVDGLPQTRPSRRGGGGGGKEQAKVQTPGSSQPKRPAGTQSKGGQMMELYHVPQGRKGTRHHNHRTGSLIKQRITQSPSMPPCSSSEWINRNKARWWGND